MHVKIESELGLELFCRFADRGKLSWHPNLKEPTLFLTFGPGQSSRFQMGNHVGDAHIGGCPGRAGPHSIKHGTSVDFGIIPKRPNAALPHGVWPFLYMLQHVISLLQLPDMPKLASRAHPENSEQTEATFACLLSIFGRLLSQQATWTAF